MRKLVILGQFENLKVKGKSLKRDWVGSVSLAIAENLQVT